MYLKRRTRTGRLVGPADTAATPLLTARLSRSPSKSGNFGRNVVTTPAGRNAMNSRVVDNAWCAELADALILHTGEVLLVSPFIKAAAIKPLLGQLAGSRIITRFSQQDFVDRVSDIAALRMLLEAGAAIRGVRHLHAKLYVFGSSRAVITSANLTVAGLNRNHEFGLVTDEPGTVGDCRKYIDDLWSRAGADVSPVQLQQWEKNVSRHLAFGGTNHVQDGALEDMGVDIGLSPPPQQTGTGLFDDSEQAFVKFLGEGNDRAPLATTTLDEVKGSGSHWALAYPTSRRPRSVRDDAVMFIARLVEDGDIRVFGRALGMAYTPGRDDATDADVARRTWKERWRRYIRVHHAEFVAGTLANGVSLGEFMDELDHRAFAATARHFSSGDGNTNPRRSIMRKPAVELHPDGEAWLHDRLEAAFAKHGKIPRHAISTLDGPELPKFPSRATSHATTDDVKTLVHEVLASMIDHSPAELDQHVTRRVCEEIEANPSWVDRYLLLCDEHSKTIETGDGKSVVNTSIGWWTKRALAATALKQVAVPSGTTSLIQRYTLLAFSPPARGSDIVA